MTRRLERMRAERNCGRKVTYESWDIAEREGLRINQRTAKRPNPATPYPCDLCGRYHLANLVPQPVWFQRCRWKWVSP